MSGNGRYSDHYRARAAAGRAVDVPAVDVPAVEVPAVEVAALDALAARLGYVLDDAQLAEMHAAVQAAEPAAARLRADPPLDDGWPVDPAHGAAWLRAR